MTRVSGDCGSARVRWSWLSLWLAIAMSLTLVGCGNSRKPRGELEFESATYSVAESAGSLTVNIKRFSGKAGIVTVRVKSRDQTAIAGQDYAAVDTVVTFEINDEAPKPVVISILDDAVVEGDKTLALDLLDPTARSRVGLVPTAIVTIKDSAPTANAGADQVVAVNQTVTLDGSASKDPESNPLTYNWQLQCTPDGSVAALSDAAAVNPTFTVDLPGAYRAALTVNDGRTTSNADTVVVGTTTNNSAPIANAGPDARITVGQPVQVSSTGSNDPDGTALKFLWQLTAVPSGSTASLSAANTADTSFTPDVAGTYSLRLTVDDCSSTVSDTVSFSTETNPPVASAGPDQTHAANSAVSLDGSGSSDPDGDTLTFAWTFASRPSGSTAVITNSTTASASFTPDRAGIFVARLTVSDGKLSASDDVAIDTTQGNTMPTANAGADQTAAVNTLVSLDGTGSSDPENNTLTYAWTLTNKPAGSNVVLSGATAARPTFTPDVTGAYEAQLVVNDGQLNSNSDTVTITVR